MGQWKFEVRHDGLNKYRVISGWEEAVVRQKVAAQLAVWEEMWAKRLETQARAELQLQRAVGKQEKIESAASQTLEAQAAVAELRNILRAAVGVDTSIAWESMKDHTLFLKEQPVPSKQLKFSSEPQESSPSYTPKFGFLDLLFSNRKKRVLQECTAHFNLDHSDWIQDCNSIRAEQGRLKRKFEDDLDAWNQEKSEFQGDQSARNRQIDALRVTCEARDTAGVIEYSDLVLSNSKYPDYFPQDWELDYNPKTKILVVDFMLPSPETLPRIKEVKYIQSKDEISEIQYSSIVSDKLYDDVVYQITLRTVSELFTADRGNRLAMIVFNGLVNGINKATGKEESSFIVSLQTKKDDFSQLNLINIEPQACFKSLKGVGTTKLHRISPITPILSSNRDDRRFVPGRAVAVNLDSTVNLASLDWEDFEHLIRELFELEFARDGGECKVTQASRDGGVDAICFDPDPIRGGKIVIQAKRYTNTVGVAAVRELYGTVINEGAIKGILITTADFGPDSHAFALGKPLTLLSGGHLLHLLERHGHKAMIDIKAAKLANNVSA
jgi:restriction system protein